MRWSGPDYERVMTRWLVRHLKREGVRETHFSRQVGLGKGASGERTFRKIKEGKRHWSLIDLCKVADHLGESPSDLLARVERFYREEGLMHPSRAAANALGMGLAGAGRAPVLIATWRREGADFILVDCDAEWKKLAQGEIRWLIGLTSREIFEAYPQVTETLERVWQTRQESDTAFWYRPASRLARKVLGSDSARKYLSATATFVPPDMVVSYTRDLTEAERE